MSLATPRKGYKSVPWLFGKEIEIPEEWEVKTISELGKIVTGSTPDTTNKKYFDNDFLWASPIDFEGEKYITQTNSMLSEKGLSISRKIPKDSVLVVCIGSTIGKIGMASVEMSTNQQINSIICNNDNSNFIYYQLQQNNYLIKNRSNQSAVPIINKTEFGKFKLILPNEISEQQKIASILSNVDNLIESTGKVITHSKKVKTGLMQKLLTRGIGHVTFKKVPWLFGKEIEIPEEWEVKRLDDVAHIQRGKFSHRPRGDPNYFNGKYPYIQTGDIEKANGFITTHSQTLNEKGKAVSKLFTTGIIVITIVGVNIGNTAITTYPIYFPDSIVGISSDSSNIQFLKILLETKKEILKNTAINNARENLNLEILRNLKIIHPQLSEQQKIASILSNIDSKITSQEQYKEKLERLKKSLMQKLLTGEVRV